MEGAPREDDAYLCYSLDNGTLERPKAVSIEKVRGHCGMC